MRRARRTGAGVWVAIVIAVAPGCVEMLPGADRAARSLEDGGDATFTDRAVVGSEDLAVPSDRSDAIDAASDVTAAPEVAPSDVALDAAVDRGGDALADTDITTDLAVTPDGPVTPDATDVSTDAGDAHDGAADSVIVDGAVGDVSDAAADSSADRDLADATDTSPDTVPDASIVNDHEDAAPVGDMCPAICVAEEQCRVAGCARPTCLYRRCI